MTEAERNAIDRCALTINDVDMLRELATAPTLSRAHTIRHLAERLDARPREVRSLVDSMIRRSIVKITWRQRRKVYVVNTDFDAWDRPGVIKQLINTLESALHRFYATLVRSVRFGLW